MDRRFAATTTVTAEKSRNEIERTLARYGADEFAYGWSAGSASVMFRADGRSIRFVLPLPDESEEFLTKGGYLKADQTKAREQAIRQRWRALHLVINAKLEAVDTGITTFEEEFLAHTLLPSGETVGEWIEPQLEETRRLGHMPASLLLRGPE